MQLKNIIQVELSDMHLGFCILRELKTEESEMGVEVMASKTL